MKKRILSVLLCLVMVLGLLPATALATALAENDSPNSVYVNNNKQLTSGQYFETIDGNAKTGTPSGNNYVAWYTGGVLTLNGYNGGKIGLAAATANHFTIKLIGNNTVNSGQICIRQQSTGGTSGVTITSDSSGTLTLNATSDNAVWAINANESSATGQGQNEVVIGGSAKVTINATMTGANQQCTGIYAKNVTIQGSASLKITCKAESNTNAGHVTGVYTWGTTTVNTTGNIDIDVSAAGGENCTSYGLGGSSGNTLTLTQVGSLTAKWKNDANRTTYKGAAFYPTTAEFANVDTGYAKNKTSTSVSYRSGTPYTVTVENGTLTGPGVNEAIYQGQFLAGDTVNITPYEQQASGYETIPFAKWTSNDVTISNPTTESNSFTVPEKNVTVTATYNPFSETPTFTPTSTTNTTGTLVFKTVVKPNGSSEYFRLVVEADKDDTAKYKSINPDSSSTTSPYTYSVSMNSSSFSAGKYYVAAKLGEGWYLSELFTVSYASAPAPSATVGDVTISGTVGTALSSGVDVIITLTSDTFNEIAAETDVGSWFTNLPAGLGAKIKSKVNSGTNSATITITDTPEAASSEAMEITIPAASLTSDAVLTVTSNTDAKFEIAKATVTNPVAITGVTTPVKGEAASTSVTAPANTSATLKWYQGSSEFDSTYAASTTYKGEITVTPSSGYQFANSVSFTVNGTEDWSATKQSDGSYKLTKEFTTASADLKSLVITTPPTKTSYTHGDTFSTDGMVVKATYDDESTDESFNSYEVEYATSGQTYLKKGDTKVTIKASEKSVEVTGLTVSAKELTITGLTATTREYEKDNTTVALTGGTLTGVVGSETVSVTMPTSGTVAAADAGADKEVAVTNPMLSGADSGNYTLKDITGVKVTILPKALTSAMIKLDSAQETYNGSEQSAKFTVMDGTNGLNLNTDYTVTSGGTATNVGNTTLTISGKGNYTGTASTTWSLVAKDISSATITVSDTYTYTGSAITPAYTVKDGSTSLTASDYNAAYSNNTDAGSTAKITLTGKGNYQGSKEQTFTINKSEWGVPTETLTATNPTTSSGNDGKITGTTSSMQYKMSTGGSWTDCTGDVTGLSAATYYVRYKEDSNHSASETNYKTVTLTDPGTTLYSVTVANGTASPSGDQAAGAEVTITATAKPGYNFEKWTGLDDGDYKTGNTNTSNPATFIMPASAVSVSATYEAAALTGTATISGTAKYGETLIASLTDTNNTGNLSYKWYRGSDEITGATGSTYTLVKDDIGKTIKVEVSSSVQTGKIASSTTGTIEKADGPAAPSAFTLGFTLNANGETYTATIPAVTGGEYSFDGTTYFTTNTKTDCTANTSYTGYVRIAETSTHKASAAINSTQATPKLTVAAPTFSPNGASSFSGTQSVTIFCTTTDATIYYTTDGTAPTTTSTEYTAPLSLTATTTVKAIAVKTDMNDSTIATATFTKYSGGSSSGGSSYNPTYAVSVDKTENGSVSVSPKNASKGTTVTVTTTPDKGWTLETLTVLDKDGKKIDLDIVKLGEKYTFKMPGSNVTVSAAFMEDNTMLNYFVDVNARDYFYDAVLWAVEKGITDGTDELHFSPNAPCTRAQIVTFLWRAVGSPEPKSEGSFSDVKAGSYYAKAVAWAVENGITGGTGDGKFSPDATCTRAQAVTFLARALNARAEGKAEFSDVPANAYYADAVVWAAENGVTTGIGGGLFDPNGSCTRAQIVVFLYRAYLGK